MGALSDKVAVVTGSAQGIGREIALALARHGADVMLNDLEHFDKVADAVKGICALGRRAEGVRADAGDEVQIRNLVGQTIAHFGKLDIAVANATYERHIPFLDSSPEDVRRTVDVILLGAYHLARHAA